MAEETPKFCSGIQENTFSAISGAGIKNNHNKRSSFLTNLENNKHYKPKKNSISKNIKENINKKRHKKRKRNNSEYSKQRKYNINNVIDFIQKHKFKLRNDFDKKNSEQFLLSKEQAFENPFLLYN